MLLLSCIVCIVHQYVSTLADHGRWCYVCSFLVYFGAVWYLLHLPPHRGQIIKLGILDRLSGS